MPPDTWQMMQATKDLPRIQRKLTHIHKSNLLYQIGLEADKNISIANNSEKK